MFLIDKPYLSDILKQTLIQSGIPVVITPGALSLGLDSAMNQLTETQAVDYLRHQDPIKLYTNSENAIGWIAENLAFTDLPATLSIFKDKAAFRRATKSLFPSLFFREIKLEDLKNTNINDLPLPFIIKPCTGFFSMGVHKISHPREWPAVLEAIFHEIETTKGIYPDQVFNSAAFIIEGCITGEEYAIDAYYDSHGDPVIVNIHKHMFASDDDVSDRVYSTSKTIVSDNLERFTGLLADMGRLIPARNFPVHAEVRVDFTGAMVPIEVNPMRFGGWCTTPDMALLAYDFNAYDAFFQEIRPDWDRLLSDKDGQVYSIVVLDNSTGEPADAIESFDYQALSSHFTRLLDLRPIDYREYPVFGIAFVETPENDSSELEAILRSDLREFTVFCPD